MATYQRPSLSIDDAAVSEHTREYYRLRLQQAFHEVILTEFNRLVEERKFTRKALADRADKDQASVTRWLQRASNMEFNTFSDLMVGMGLDPRKIVERLGVPAAKTKSAAQSTAEANASLADLRRDISGAQRDAALHHEQIQAFRAPSSAQFVLALDGFTEQLTPAGNSPQGSRSNVIAMMGRKRENPQDRRGDVYELPEKAPEAACG